MLFPWLLLGGLGWFLLRHAAEPKLAVMRTVGFKVLVQPGAIYHVGFEFSDMTPEEFSQLPAEFDSHGQIELYGVSLKKTSALTAVATVTYRALSSSEITVGSKVNVGPYEGKIISVTRQL